MFCGKATARSTQAGCQKKTSRLQLSSKSPVQCGLYILVMHDNDLSFCHIHRTYSNPHPENRFILDCVSNFVSAVSASLKLGTVRLCRFPVEFCLDVFKFLFDGKGTTSSGIAGKLYNRGEFDSKYFPEGWSTVCDKL